MPVHSGGQLRLHAFAWWSSRASSSYKSRTLAVSWLGLGRLTQCLSHYTRARLSLQFSYDYDPSARVSLCESFAWCFADISSSRGRSSTVSSDKTLFDASRRRGDGAGGRGETMFVFFVVAFRFLDLRYGIDAGRGNFRLEVDTSINKARF